LARVPGCAYSEIPHTLLRFNAYMQNVLALAPAIATTSSFGSSAGNGRSGLVDARDVAAVAAEIITSPAAHAGKTYWLTGPELVSNYDVATVLSKLLRRTITYRELTFEENKDAMIRAGVPEQIAEMNAQAFSLTAGGDAEWVTQDVQSLLGRPARSLEQFTRRLRRRVLLERAPDTHGPRASAGGRPDRSGNHTDVTPDTRPDCPLRRPAAPHVPPPGHAAPPSAEGWTGVWLR
jgi:hypothetical protein